MGWLPGLCEQLWRALHLLALTFAPSALSPEPLPPSHPVLRGLLAAVAFAALLYAPARYARWSDTGAARFAAALTWVAVAALLVATTVFRGAEAPLARGIAFVALPVWGAVAANASALAGDLLGSNWKHKRMAPVVIVLCGAAYQLSQHSKLLGSTERMWRSALRHDPGQPAAVAGLGARLVARRKYSEARELTRSCNECACLEVRADAALGSRALEEARDTADRFLASCALDASAARVRAIHAEAVALIGSAAADEVER